MLQPHVIRRFLGLYGSVNPLDAPEGAMEVADNCVIRSRDVIEPRRGYSQSVALAAGAVPNAIAFKQGRVVAITYDTPTSIGRVNVYNPATDSWSVFPMNPGGLPIDNPGSILGVRTRFVSANKALYFQSRYGLVKIEDVSSAVCRAALQPKQWTKAATSIGFGTNVVAFAGDTWLANGNQVAYRFTIARKGANGELIESEPSERVLASNTSGSAQGVSIAILNAWMTPTDAFYRIWRSKQVANGTDPSDELFLVAELLAQSFGAPLTPGGYCNMNSSIGYFDRTPDTALYVPLYTNPQSGNGIGQANAPAPLAQDTVWFKSRMHYLNTTDVHRLIVKLIGTGTGGIVDGDKITIVGVPFTFRTTLTALGTDVQLFTAGTVSQNIDNTARDLTAKVNRYFGEGPAGNTSSPVAGRPDTLPSLVFASYLSTSGTDAGQILLQRVVAGADAFTVTTSSRNGWDRDYTAGANSDPSRQVAGWMWSNPGQPEGVPTANNNVIGDASADAQRAVPLKDSLFVFKKDGLWKITDDGSSLGPQVSLFDPTVRLIAPDTAVAFDNTVTALCDQGVLVTAEGGKANVSHDTIERDLLKLIQNVGLTTVANYAFAIAYEAEHQYILCLPESPNATSCTRVYVFNLQTQAWTTWSLPQPVTRGAVNPDTGQLVFGTPNGTLLIERKNGDSTDYQDPSVTIPLPWAP